LTVLLFFHQRVVRNFAFRAGERIAEMVKALAEIVPPKK